MRCLFAPVVVLVMACGPDASGGASPGDDDDDGDGDGGGAAAHDGGTVDPPPVPDAGAEPSCSGLVATVRDFSPATHADFEPPLDSDFAYPGLVEPLLGADDTPVYAHPGPTQQTVGPNEFAQWYHDTPGVNLALPVTIELVESPAGSGRFVYDSMDFFPIDGLGFGNEGRAHNFHFTTEIHTTFTYHGGEIFSFIGDDDLWLFINGRLAIDLGGLHPPLAQTVDLDASAAALGLVVGHEYAMEIFHAERHTENSNFHVETTIDCFVIP